MSMVIFFVDQNHKNKSLSEILDIKKLMNVDRPIENANGLPNECYISEQYLEYEKNTIFCDLENVYNFLNNYTYVRPYFDAMNYDTRYILETNKTINPYHNFETRTIYKIDIVKKK